MLASRVNRTKADKALYSMFLCLMVWLPLPLGSNRPWAWHLLEIIVFTLFALWCILYIKGTIRTGSALRNGWPALACLLTFALAVTLQIIPLPSEWVAQLRVVDPVIETAQYITVSIDPYNTLGHLRTTLAFTGIAFLTLTLVDSASRLKQFAIIIVISGVFQAAYGSLMTLSGIEYGFFIPKEHYTTYATGTFVNRNHLANYLILCLSIGTGLLLSELYQRSSKGWRERGQRIVNALLGNKARVRIGLALMVIALVLTKSRMGNTAFFFSLLFSGCVWIILTKRVTRGSIALLVSLIIIDSFIVGAWFGIDKVKQRLETTAFSSETRDEVNRDTWRMIQEQPVLGTGAGTFYAAFPRYRQGDIPIYYDHAHNDYFQFLAEHGVLGVIPLIILIGLSLWKALSVMVKRKTLQFQAMAFAPLMSIVAMSMHSLVDFSLQIPANAATFVAILCLSWVVSSLKQGKHP